MNPSSDDPPATTQEYRGLVPHTKSVYGQVISFLVENVCFYLNFDGNCFSKVGQYVTMKWMIEQNSYNFLKYHTKSKNQREVGRPNNK
jgi:hypothetical protein